MSFQLIFGKLIFQFDKSFLANQIMVVKSDFMNDFRFRLQDFDMLIERAQKVAIQWKLLGISFLESFKVFFKLQKIFSILLVRPHFIH